jgi:hypothetical protein
VIAWQNALAFWALPVAAIPILIHLLRLHRADRVPFPSLRFVRPSHTAAVRLRVPSDVLLLVVRIGVLALAVAALARPILITDPRLAAWDAMTARAVVVDVSESMQEPGADAVAPARGAAESAEAELSTAAYGRRFESRRLEDGLARAVAWLASVPPARREVVLLSDFQRGTLDEALVRAVPKAVGLRFVQVGKRVTTRRIDGSALLGTESVAARMQSIDLTTESTAVTASPSTLPISGLRVIDDPRTAESRRRAIERLLRAVAAAGAPASSKEEPLAIRFVDKGEWEPPIPIGPVRAGWMLRTVLRAREDADMSAVARQIDAQSIGSMPVGARDELRAIVARDRNGRPLAWAASAGPELLLDIAAAPDSLFAAAVVRAALTARRAPPDYAEREIAQIDSSTLDAWSRPPAPVSLDLDSNGLWRNADSTDARWCWLAAIVLVGLEQWLRARPARQAGPEVSREAA